MRQAQVSYITLDNENKVLEIYFDGVLGADLKAFIKSKSWLKWEKRISDKSKNKEKWFLIADVSDTTDTDEFGIGRCNQLTIAMSECGIVWFYCRENRLSDWDSDYQKYFDLIC